VLEYEPKVASTHKVDAVLRVEAILAGSGSLACA
jgi:hypothetical protein